MPDGFFPQVLFLLKEYGPLFARGTLNTVIIAIAGTVLGFLMGLLVGIGRTIRLGPNPSPLKKWAVRILQGVLGVYIEVFRGTPMIVQAMVFYYGLAQYAHVQLPALFAAILVVTINTGAYMAEIIRGGIISVDEGQTEAAHSIGLTHWQTMTSVVLPQAIRNIMPSIGNEFIVNIKDSSVLNVISVAELYFQTKSAAGTYFAYFQVFMITAMIYLLLTFTTSRILRLVERRMDGPENFTVMGSQTDSRAVIAVRKAGTT